MARREHALRQKLMERAMEAYDREGPVGAVEVRKRLETALAKRNRTATELQLHLLNIHERRWLFRHLLLDFDGEDLVRFSALCWHVADSVLAIGLEESDLDVFGPQLPMVRGWLSKEDPSEILVLATTTNRLDGADPLAPIAEFLSEYGDAGRALLFVWPALADRAPRVGGDGTRAHPRAKPVHVVDGETLREIVLVGMDVEDADAMVDDLNGRYERARADSSRERALGELRTAERQARRLRSRARELAGLPPLD